MYEIICFLSIPTIFFSYACRIYIYLYVLFITASLLYFSSSFFEIEKGCSTRCLLKYWISCGFTSYVNIRFYYNCISKKNVSTSVYFQEYELSRRKWFCRVEGICEEHGAKSSAWIERDPQQILRDWLIWSASSIQLEGFNERERGREWQIITTRRIFTSHCPIDNTCYHPAYSLVSKSLDWRNYVKMCEFVENLLEETRHSREHSEYLLVFSIGVIELVLFWEVSQEETRKTTNSSQKKAFIISVLFNLTIRNL